MTRHDPQKGVRVDRAVDGLRQNALRMAGLAEQILDKSLRALWDRNPDLPPEVKQDDLEIDQLDVDLDMAVLNTLALQAPVAADLRLVLSIKSMATDLERVGDLARNIAGSAQRLIERAEVPPTAQLRNLARDSQRSLSRAIQSFADLDPDLAREVLDFDDEIDEAEAVFIRGAMEKIHVNPEEVDQQIDFILIAKSLERIADHATNIAEDVILASEALNIKHLEKLSS